MNLLKYLEVTIKHGRTVYSWFWCDCTYNRRRDLRSTRSVQRYSTFPRFDLAVIVLTHAVLRPCPYSLSLVICLFPLSWISPIQQTMISMFLHQRLLFTLNAGWHHCSTEDWGWQLRTLGHVLSIVFKPACKGPDYVMSDLVV